MKIVFLEKKTRILGIIWRVFIVLAFLLLIVFCVLGIYFFIQHRNLPQTLNFRLEATLNRNNFLEATIDRLDEIMGQSDIEAQLEFYSSRLFSLPTQTHTQEQTISGLSVDGLLEYTQSVLEYFSQIAQNTATSESIFRTTPLTFPFREHTRFVIKRPFSAEQDQLCPFTNALVSRSGIVFGAELQTPVVSPADGVVANIRNDIFFGRTIRIRHSGEYITFFGHLENVSVRVGQRITRGTQIGTVGQTGWTTGPQVYFSIIRNGVYIDPIQHNFSLLSPN